MICLLFKNIRSGACHTLPRRTRAFETALYPAKSCKYASYRPNLMGIRGRSDGLTILAGITLRIPGPPSPPVIIGRTLVFCLTPTQVLDAGIFCPLHLAGAALALILCLVPSRFSESRRF